MSKFYAEPVLCLKDEHRLRPPCRVAAEASSAALPSCQLLPAAASCLEASWHIRVWQGGASVRSTATVPCPRHHRPQAPSSVGAPLTTQPSASTAFRVRWVQILMSIALHFIGQCTSVPSHLLAEILTIVGLPPARFNKSPAGTRGSSSIAGIFFIELLSTGIVRNHCHHREHLNTKRNPPSSSVQARARLRRNSYPRTAALCHPQIYPVVLVMSPMVQIDHTRATVGARQ